MDRSFLKPVWACRPILSCIDAAATAADLQEVYGAAASLSRRSDSDTASNDPVWRLEVKEDGAYRVTSPRSFRRYVVARPGQRLSPVDSQARRRIFASLAVAEPPPDQRRTTAPLAPRTALLRAGGTIAIKSHRLSPRWFCGRHRHLSADEPARGHRHAIAGENPRRQRRWRLCCSPRARKLAALGRADSDHRQSAKVGDTDVGARGARRRDAQWTVVADFANLTPVQTRLTRDISARGQRLRRPAPVSVEPAEDKVLGSRRGRRSWRFRCKHHAPRRVQGSR